MILFIVLLQFRRLKSLRRVHCVYIKQEDGMNEMLVASEFIVDVSKDFAFDDRVI